MLPTGQLHHAYIIEGNPKDTRDMVFADIQQRLELTPQSQDFFVIEASMFGVEEANLAIDIHSRKATHKGNKGIVLVADTFSHQAQNALLKTLEEPNPGTFFFILTSSASTFLPTVLSRVHVVTSKPDGVLQSKHTCLSPHTFVSESKPVRLKTIKEIIKLKEDEKIGDAEIFSFITGVEQSIFHKVKGTQDEVMVSTVLTTVSDYMRDTSSSKKMLLEYMALELPVVQK